MKSHYPDAPDLLVALTEMLETQFLPALEKKELKYQARVAINILGIIQRELAQKDSFDELQRESLADLLPDAGSGDLNTKLASQIRDGLYDDDANKLLAHLKDITLAKIEIDNPHYATLTEFKLTGELKIP